MSMSMRIAFAVPGQTRLHRQWHGYEHWNKQKTEPARSPPNYHIEHLNRLSQHHRSLKTTEQNISALFMVGQDPEPQRTAAARSGGCAVHEIRHEVLMLARVKGSMGFSDRPLLQTGVSSACVAHHLTATKWDKMRYASGRLHVRL